MIKITTSMIVPASAPGVSVPARRCRPGRKQSTIQLAPKGPIGRRNKALAYRIWKPVMNITDALLGEHGAFYTLFDKIEEIAACESRMAMWRGATTVLEAMVESHATLEEELLVPALEPHMGKQEGPLALMIAEHDEMGRMITHIQDEPDLNRAILWIPEALEAAREHFRKEEQILFPMAEHLLGERILQQLGANWAKCRQVTIK